MARDADDVTRNGVDNGSCHRRTELVIRCDSSRNRGAATRRKGCSPCITLNGIAQQAVGENAVTLIVTQHVQFTGAYSGNTPGLLNVGEEKQFVLHDRAANNAAKLMLFQLRLGGIEVAGRIQPLVSVKLEKGSMEAVGSRLCDRIHDGTGELSILSAEAIGQQTKLRD